MPATDGGRKVVLAIVDGLTPAALDAGLAAGRLPTLAAIAAHGSYATGTTTFPSLTPVCLSTIATGAHPDVHHIPHLVWYHRGEQRLVEYGSSFWAIRAAGARQTLRDTIVNMTQEHLAREATTVFEAVEDAGLVAAAINFTCYRGRTRHACRVPLLNRRNGFFEEAWGPQRFFFFNVFESDATGAPLAVRARAAGSIDAYAAAVGRWLVTRDGFDFLVFYLPDFDYASHAAGPDGALAALERSDAAIGELLLAAGGLEAFLERYAILVVSDHGQTSVDRVAQLEDAYADLAVYRGRRDGDPGWSDVAVAASNRAGMVYRLPSCRLDPRALAERLDAVPAADVVLFREGGEAVARRDGEELRFAPGRDGWRLDGDAAVLDPALYPDALERAWRALACPNAGDVVVSAAGGYEFADLGGGNHAGGGSHGSLLADDSTVPFLAAGLALPPALSTADVAPLLLAHPGIAPPGSMSVPVPAGA